MTYLCTARRFIQSLAVKPSSTQVSSWYDVNDLCKEGRLKEALAILHKNADHHGISLDPETYAALLHACLVSKALAGGKQLHAKVLISGSEQNPFLGTQLVGMYAGCGSLENARQVFDKIHQRTFLLWNAMIRGYAKGEPYEEAITLYYQMQKEGIQPDNFTFPLVLKACATLLALEEGKEIHRHIVRMQLESDIYVGAALIDMYAKCGSIEDAREVFDKMPRRDVVSWNAMITGYAKCGKLEVARHLFDKMPQRTVISWTTMIAGYVQNGHFHEALELYGEMHQTEFKPNRVTLVSVLPACAHLGALQQGKTIHDYIIRRKLETDVSVVTALINMYAKCGQIDVARELFDKMYKRDAISWNAMIAGYGMHGQGEAVVSLFVQMQQTGVKPDDVTLVGVLSACSHAGLVEEGLQYFHSMNRDYGLVPKMEHYACMVDLLSRAGRLDEARDMIAEMPFKPSPSVWGALLSACRTHGKIELGEYVARHLFEIEPYNTGNYVLLSNIYADAGRWDDVMKIRIMLKERGLKKSPGCSWVEVNNRAHGFIGGDRSHPQSEEIYTLLENLGKQMKKFGYLTDTSFVLHDVAEEEKEFAISTHSERLAIAFGILNTAPGTPIQITKNLRVCGDCHTATKFISKIVRREITVRDINRFHHFKDGLCSCGDYW
jgi:pentatricopeptide repeat protein